MVNKIFLGGTCADTTWREELINFLEVDSFNPVVEDWAPACQANEEREKEHDCNIHLYVITSKMQGVFSIAEVIDSVHQKNKTTVLQVVPDGFSAGQLKSLEAVVYMVRRRGGIAFIENDIYRAAIVLNSSFKD